MATAAPSIVGFGWGVKNNLIWGSANNIHTNSARHSVSHPSKTWQYGRNSIGNFSSNFKVHLASSGGCGTIVDIFGLLSDKGWTMIMNYCLQSWIPYSCYRNVQRTCHIATANQLSCESASIRNADSSEVCISKSQHHGVASTAKTNTRREVIVIAFCQVEDMFRSVSAANNLNVVDKGGISECVLVISLIKNKVSLREWVTNYQLT